MRGPEFRIRDRLFVDGFKYILSIRDKPMVLLGEKLELARIECYLMGFYQGQGSSGVEIHSVFRKFMSGGGENFQSFVCAELDPKANKPWYLIIEFASSSQEEAVDIFYRLLDKYLEKWGYDGRK